MSEVYVKEPTTNGKAIFRTTHGDLEVELWATECPKACRNFCQLILEGYYNDTIFHRVIKDFIIQGGDGTNTGDGSESIYGSPYPDEIHPRLKFRYRGMMGVASAGRGSKTNGSQFFIVMDRTPSLDGKHTLFGKVVGQTVYNLVRMSEVEVDKKDRPFDPPKILRAELVWNPFDDLEPRRRPSPPRSAGGAPGSAEAHRRAPIRNKKVLSFTEEDADSDEDAGGGGSSSSAAKGKSAHDLLVDPKLSKEKAYPEQKPQGRQAPAEGKAKPDPASVSKRAAAVAAGASASRPNAIVRASTSKKAAAGGGSSSDDSGSDSEDVDFGAEDESSEEQDTVTKKKSVNRREDINRLKREIAAVGNEPEEDKTSKKRRPGSALEELRAGYQARERRVKATGKEGKRMEADAMLRTLKDFRSRLSAFATQADEGSDEEEKAEKAEKAKAEKAKQEKEKKEEDKKNKKDKKDQKKKKDKDDEKKPEPEDGTFAAIWAEGDEEADKDWLSGRGLKFHVTADKAFKLDRDRARATLDIFDPLAAKGNNEVLADARKKASEKMVPLRRNFAKAAKESRDDDREPFRR